MPFTLSELNHCAISGKPLEQQDFVVVFPVYKSHLGEPEHICSENIALRDEFENWQYRDRVISRVRSAWVEWYRNTKSYSILWDHDSFLVVESLLEDKIRIFFLNHVFAVELIKEQWNEFQQKTLTIREGHILLRSNVSLFWKTYPSYTNLLIVDKEWRDTIDIPSSEWEHLMRFFSSKDRN